MVVKVMRKLSVILLNLCLSVFLFGQNSNMIGKEAKPWKNINWIDADGNETNIDYASYKGKVVYILNYQSWCPGCHSIGLPRLKKLISNYNDTNDVSFLVIQTVFEGFNVNTQEKNRETQIKYDLNIPFGYDAGSNSSYPEMMMKYKTGGTPWVIIIDRENKIKFSNFHLENSEAISLIDQLVEN